MKEFVQKIAEGQNLSRDEASSAMRTIMEGNATEAQIAAFLIGLKLKEEHPDELLGFVEVMREKSVKVRVDDPAAIDMCGTGGDGTGTFNISTVASFVVAGAGATVAKHGNRSISSVCGSADVLKALGVNLDLSPEMVEACINAEGIGFLFAPLFHPAMKHAAKPRSELGIKTCFNMLGPMTNPAGVRRQLVGAFNQKAAASMSAVFERLGVDKVYVVCAEDGMDEISLSARTTVHEVDREKPSRAYELDPASFSLSAVERSSILGGTAEMNATITMHVLEGVKSPHRDIVLANATFGLLAAGKARSIAEGVRLAAESIDSGRALDKLKRLREFTNR